MKLTDVATLAHLSRIEMTEAEQAELLHDMQAILGYIEQIESLPITIHTAEPMLHNVMREDVAPHASGVYTDALISAAPASEAGFVKVTQTLALSGAEVSDADTPSL